MTYLCSSAAVRLVTLTTLILFCGSSNLGSAQTIEEILARSRATVENISSYEYSAISKSNFGNVRRFFFARDEETYRFDQKIENPKPQMRIFLGELHPFKLNWNWDSKEFRVGFDGKYFFEDNEQNEVVKSCSPPIFKADVVDPFHQCFEWLTVSNCRSEILKKSRWEEFAKTCESFISRKVDGHACFVSISRPVIEGWRYEVAFAEDMGCLPIRIRRLVGDERRVGAEWNYAAFKHFNIDGASFYFPTQYSFKTAIRGTPIWYVTKIKPDTLRINGSLDFELLRLQHESVAFTQMIAEGNEQKWFSDEMTAVPNDFGVWP